MKKGFSILIWMTLLIGLVVESCDKNVPEKNEPIVKPDVRDTFVGDYEVWDTMFLYRAGIFGQDSFAFEGVFHYPKVHLAKERVSYTSVFGKIKFDDGFSYRPVIVDKSFISPNGFNIGFFGYQHLFTINSRPNLLGDQDEIFWNLILSNSYYSGNPIKDSTLILESYIYKDSKYHAFAQRIQ